MLHTATRGATHSLNEAPFPNSTSSPAQRPRHGFAAPRPASTPMVPPSDRVSPTLQRFHSSSGPSPAALDLSTASSSHPLSSSPAPAYPPNSSFSAPHSSYTFSSTSQYASGSTSSWSDLPYPRQDEQSSGILRGGAGGRVGSSEDGVRRELSGRATYGEEIVAAIKEEEEEEEVERRQRWAMEASLAPTAEESWAGELDRRQDDTYYEEDAYYVPNMTAHPAGDIGEEFDFAFDSPGLVAARHEPVYPSAGSQMAYDGYRDGEYGAGSGNAPRQGDNSPISPLPLYADDLHHHPDQRSYACRPDSQTAYYDSDKSASPESPFQPFFVPAGPRPVPFASASSRFGRVDPLHSTYSHSAPSVVGHFQHVPAQSSSYDYEGMPDPAAHFAPFYASYEMRSPMSAFQSFHIASGPQSPADEFPPPLPSSPQSLPTTASPLFPAYHAPRHGTTSPPSSRRSLLANALGPRQTRPQSLEIAQAFVKVEDPDSPTLLASPVPLLPSSAHAPSSSSKAGKGKKRRSSSSACSVDPDWTPSSPTRAPPSPRKVHSTRVSPITGKPVKVISPRSWPPKDQHKRIYTCDFPGCDKSFGRPSARDTHVRSHSGVKPFMCPIPSCGRTFSVFSNLKRHMIVHPTVDFRHVTVNDLPLIHWVPDADPEASKAAGGEGGRLEWIDEDVEEEEEAAVGE
ncbi:Proteophosphoglycan ppg4 [Rhodotorula toruloides ATCC 204091]|uniref:Proteophosphoglycan ppg4 n=1 Tax=Rhodotorula toruloides TaxID=5286 RepID=A0A0K3C965_RHOTO|nr:Proteophosphoglycan ppg4 [Rhodotorula toruloides ATCC 204091]KAK4334676.1 Proteophosphoglycan ppg4 [Rhodotorula toruloides]PRQ76583.1 Proteophosphoglycan ppg4 [Rhodotorula toruloides]